MGEDELCSPVVGGVLVGHTLGDLVCVPADEYGARPAAVRAEVRGEGPVWVQPTSRAKCLVGVGEATLHFESD
ncbi:hypothetical protein AB4212_01685 [Streptomyces sp. 2MCAF27]